MEASYGSSSSTRRRNTGESNVWVCICGNNLKISTSWTNQNPGRRYLVCSNEKGLKNCSFFEWFDPPMCSRSKMIIPGLLKRINKNEQEIQRLTGLLEDNRSKGKKNMYIGLLVMVVMLVCIVSVFVYLGKTIAPMNTRMLSYEV
nr:DNA topoisomerase [Ipomoea batatas]